MQLTKKQIKEQEKIQAAFEKLKAESSATDIARWKVKADQWDALGEKIAKYYPEGMGPKDTDGDGNEDKFDDSDGLIGIGELAATAFGWL